MAVLQIAVSSPLSFPFLFLCVSFFAFLFPFANANAGHDVTSLLAFKSAVTNDPFLYLQNWRPTTPANACNWSGVTCSRRHPGRVVKVDLSNINLSGQIPPHVGNLSFLQVLDLSSNDFSGYIPSSLARLRRLRILHLGSNTLSGAIPRDLGNLSSLRFLSLSDNNLKEGIPSSLGQLSNLEALGLYKNSYLGGPIPASLGGLKKLKRFLSYNSGHTGRIPLALCNCSLLMNLQLSENQLGGTIPDCLGSLSQLQWLTLESSSLHGHVPESIWNLTSLQILSLAHNNLTGTLPSSLGNLLRLQLVHLGFNQFAGRIPAQLANCTALIQLGLMGNQLTGELPDWLGRLSQLQKLMLYDNEFTGKIPDSLKNCTELQVLALNGNQLSGTIPSSIGQLSQLSKLSLDSNYFVSGLSSSEEPIPALKTLYNCSQLTYLSLGHNFLRGALPWDIGMHWPGISTIDLESCEISGRIPESIGNISSLLILAFRGNFLSGSIPESCGKMKGIQELALNDNRLSGSIPWQITFLNGSLAYLYLQNNELSGPLTPFLGNLTNLQQLDLSGNSFSGRIPRELGNCKDLLALDLSSNKFSGTIPPEVVDLKHVQLWFDLSGNFLTGDLPTEIEGLTMVEQIKLSGNQLRGNIGFLIEEWLNAQYVNISDNNFSGEVPESIAKKLTQLQTMDLSHNNFTGPIPESLFNLSQLTYLDVSYNNFQGRVPCLGTFVNRSKILLTHNPQLCGDCFSLPKCETYKRQRSYSCLTLLKICIPIGGALIILLGLVSVILKRKARASSATGTGMQFLGVSLEELQMATENFSEANLIGQGRHGLVYRGTLQGGIEIAIKVFSVSSSALSTSNTASFIRECKTLRKVQHRNLIRIINICVSTNFKALVLPLMPNSLHKLLHQENIDANFSRASFNLQIRLRILRELATALSYLHHDCTPGIVHCDVKPQNILLDEEMTVYLSDFGIARLLPQEFTSNSSSTTVAVGSFGYMAPEYGITGRVSTKGDVYSFGIVVFEVLTGLMPTHSMFEGNLTLSKWISTALLQNSEDKEERMEGLKKVIGEGRRGVGKEIEKEEEWMAVEAIMKVGIMCSCERAEQRPSMRDVQEMLYSISLNVEENNNENDEEEVETNIEI